MATALTSWSVFKDLKLVRRPEAYLHRRLCRARQTLEDCMVNVGPVTKPYGMRSIQQALADTPCADGSGGLPRGSRQLMGFSQMT